MARKLVAAGLTLALTMAAVASSLAAPAPPRRIAFNLEQGHRILFPIRIDNQQAEAWLDSGASVTVIDAAYAKTLGLTAQGDVSGHGVSGAVHGGMATADIEVGDLKLNRARVAVLDLSPVARAINHPVQVILGRNLFDAGVVDIDFEGRTLGVVPPDQFHPPVGALELPLTPAHALRVFPVSMSGGPPVLATLDLGNAGALLLTKDLTDARGLFSGRRTSTALSYGADGPQISAVGTVASLDLAGVSFHDVPALAAVRPNAEAPANVGLEILSRFHLFVDFGHDRLWLQPYRGPRAAFRKNRAGVSGLVEDGALRIAHVAPGSPAEASGWAVGDRVAAIDGKPIGADYVTGGQAGWINGPAGQVVTLTLADGSQRKLTLADYY